MAGLTGEQIFGRYACSPNELGYCGPEVAHAFSDVASGKPSSVDIRQAASEFSGVWIYLEILASLLKRDPLDPEIVRGYWIGNGLVDSVDKAQFWERLIAVISTRAGTYWKYLDASLEREAHPSHAFHVLGIYPWTRLLNSGRQEPVDVVNSCCIRPGVVVSTSEKTAVIEQQEMIFSQGQLHLEKKTITNVPILFEINAQPGESVALHWGSVCDVLTDQEHVRLTNNLVKQISLVNQRLSS